MRKTANKTIEEVFKELCKKLKNDGCFPDGYFNICYPESDYSNEFPPYHCIACFPISDNNKHFIRVEVILNEKRRLVFLGKTLKGFEFACKIANSCAKHLGA
jgi:hypothetical protein